MTLRRLNMQKVSVKIDIPVCYGMRGRASHNTFPRRAWERVKMSKLLLKECFTQQIKLHFFDLEASIKSDSGNFISLFTRMYRRFQADELSPSVQTYERIVHE